MTAWYNNLSDTVFTFRVKNIRKLVFIGQHFDRRFKLQHRATSQTVYGSTCIYGVSCSCISETILAEGCYGKCIVMFCIEYLSIDIF